MALISQTEDGEWAFQHGKHIGKTLDEVAEEDPSYLKWMFNKASDGLSKEAFFALEDVMGLHNIDP